MENIEVKKEEGKEFTNKDVLHLIDTITPLLKPLVEAYCKKQSIKTKISISVNWIFVCIVISILAVITLLVCVGKLNSDIAGTLLASLIGYSVGNFKKSIQGEENEG